MEKTLPGVVHIHLTTHPHVTTHSYLTTHYTSPHTLHLPDRVNALYAREGVLVPEAYLILILFPAIGLVHKVPMITEWEPPPSCSHVWKGPLTELPEVLRETL